jgi:hypothetical protein
MPAASSGSVPQPALSPQPDALQKEAHEAPYFIRRGDGKRCGDYGHDEAWELRTAFVYGASETTKRAEQMRRRFAGERVGSFLPDVLSRPSHTLTGCQ